MLHPSSLQRTIKLQKIEHELQSIERRHQDQIHAVEKRIVRVKADLLNLLPALESLKSMITEEELQRAGLQDRQNASENVLARKIEQIKQHRGELDVLMSLPTLIKEAFDASLFDEAIQMMRRLKSLASPHPSHPLYRDLLRRCESSQAELESSIRAGLSVPDLSFEAAVKLVGAWRRCPSGGLTRASELYLASRDKVFVSAVPDLDYVVFDVAPPDIKQDIASKWIRELLAACKQQLVPTVMQFESLFLQDKNQDADADRAVLSSFLTHRLTNMLSDLATLLPFLYHKATLFILEQNIRGLSQLMQSAGIECGVLFDLLLTDRAALKPLEYSIRA